MADLSRINEVVGLKGGPMARSTVITFYCSRPDSLVQGLTHSFILLCVD